MIWKKKKIYIYMASQNEWTVSVAYYCSLYLAKNFSPTSLVVSEVILYTKTNAAVKTFLIWKSGFCAYLISSFSDRIRSEEHLNIMVKNIKNLFLFWEEGIHFQVTLNFHSQKLCFAVYKLGHQMLTRQGLIVKANIIKLLKYVTSYTYPHSSCYRK